MVLESVSCISGIGNLYLHVLNFLLLQSLGGDRICASISILCGQYTDVWYLFTVCWKHWVLCYVFLLEENLCCYQGGLKKKLNSQQHVQDEKGPAAFISRGNNSEYLSQSSFMPINFPLTQSTPPLPPYGIFLLVEMHLGFKKFIIKLKNKLLYRKVANVLDEVDERRAEWEKTE